MVTSSVMPGRGDEALLRADVPRAYFCGAKNVDGRDKPNQTKPTRRSSSSPRAKPFLTGAVKLAGLASSGIKTLGANHEICTLDVLPDRRRRQRLVRGDGVCAVRDGQEAALSATDNGSARRKAEAARRTRHESLKRRLGRTVQSDDAQPGAWSAAVRPVSLSALGNFRPYQAERVCDPDHRAPVALAGRVVRARAAGVQGGAFA